MSSLATTVLLVKATWSSAFNYFNPPRTLGALTSQAYHTGEGVVNSSIRLALPDEAHRAGDR